MPNRTPLAPRPTLDGPRAYGRAADDLPPLGALAMVDALILAGTTSRAADRLGVTRTAVSQAISRLERRIGVPLFRLEGGRHYPTSAGEELAKAYRRASSLLSGVVSDIVTEAPPALSASLPACAASLWISGALGRLRALGGGVRLDTHRDGEVPDLIRFDAAVFMGGQPEEAADWDGHPLFAERVIPVCAPGYADAQGLRAGAPFRTEHLIVHSTKAWRNWFDAAGLAAPDLEGMRILDPALGLEAALRGQGVFLACTVASAPPLAEGRLVAPVDRSASTGRVARIGWRNIPPPSDQVFRFVGWIEDELRAIASRHVDLLI